MNRWTRFVEWSVTKLAACFPSRYRLIPRMQDGVPLLRQFKINRWVYLQSFVNPECAETFHRHRWGHMRSFVLSGKFEEERYPGKLYITHRAGTTYTMDHGVIHRLHMVEPGTWTLFVMLNDRYLWGYYARPDGFEFTQWDKAIPPERRIKSL